MSRFLFALFIIGLIGSACPAGATVFLDTAGFEDDVDLIVSPMGEFLVVPEESEFGDSARVTIFDLVSATGAPIGPTITFDVPGFENGVDLMTMHPTGAPSSVLLVPWETENGEQAGIVVLKVDDVTGMPFYRVDIDLGNLGFRDDVDGTWTDFPKSVAFFALESEDRSVRGVIAIDIWDGPPDFDFGGCSLISTNGRAGCGEAVEVDWLPGLAEGVDPLSFAAGTSARLVLPVSSGSESDLLLLDYDPNDCLGCGAYPEFLDYTSVKEVNAGGAQPTDFPGFERDVDLRLFPGGECGFIEGRILVPVEGAGDIADLYLLDEDGVADWVLSIDGGLEAGEDILGYEAGVDVVPMCLGGGVDPNRLGVPLENSDGSDADFWIVNLETGELMARVEEMRPAPIPGYEIGVDPVLWGGANWLVAVEGSDKVGGLLAVNPFGAVVSGESFADLGFTRSVDPIVVTLPGGREPLFVPVVNNGDGDFDILMYPAAPCLGGCATSLEELNDPIVTFSGFTWDVDLGTVENGAPGNSWLYLPEEDAVDHTARVRFEPFGDHVAIPLIVATPAAGALPATLYFFEASTGFLDTKFEDVLGLETGLDMASGRGPIIKPNPPASSIPAGQDADTDPTLVWMPEPAACVTLEDLDVGNLLCSITNQGIIGFSSGDQSRGAGFVFPADGGANHLYIGSLWAGTNAAYALNRDFDTDPVADWVAEGCMAPGGSGVADQEWMGATLDLGHPAPRGLKIVQHSFAWSSFPDNDYVILGYEAQNTGSTPIRGLRLGPYMDWDIGGSTGYNQNRGGFDAGRGLLYMWRQPGGDGTHVGIKALSPLPASQASFIHNPTYIYPQGYILDSDRFHFLSGDVPAYVVHSTPLPSDWSSVLSAGPFELAPGASVQVWFALLNSVLAI